MVKRYLAAFLAAALLLCGCGNRNVPAAGAETSPPEETTAAPITERAKLAVVGDIMCHSWQYEEAYVRDGDYYDFSHNFADVKKYFDAADLTVGNLETVFAGRDVGISDFPLFNSPDEFGGAIKNAGFGLLTTANNHSLDKGEAGLLRTLEALDGLGIDHVGTYASQADRDKVLVKDINGIRFAFLAYTYGTNGLRIPNEYNINILDEEQVKKDIKKAKLLYAPDFIVVMPHMGNEYETYPRDTFKSWADMMIEAGADVILASHPHVLQPMEVREVKNPDGSRRDAFVIYSLGNFISSQTTPPRNAGLILNLTFEKTEGEKAFIREVSFVPVWTQFQNAKFKNHFVVRSVYEMLTLSPEEQKETLRAKDAARLRDIHFETTGMYLNREVPLEEIKDEYIFYVKE